MRTGSPMCMGGPHLPFAPATGVGGPGLTRWVIETLRASGRGRVLATVGASRIRALTTALGIDRIMSGHRWLGVAAVVLVLGHMVAAIVESPKLLNPVPTQVPAARSKRST